MVSARPLASNQQSVSSQHPSVFLPLLEPQRVAASAVVATPVIEKTTLGDIQSLADLKDQMVSEAAEKLVAKEAKKAKVAKTEKTVAEEAEVAEVKEEKAPKAHKAAKSSKTEETEETEA